VRIWIILLVCAMVVGCGTEAPNATRVLGRHQVAMATPHMTAAAVPVGSVLSPAAAAVVPVAAAQAPVTSAPAAAAAPSTRTVGFSHLSPGTYAVHLHSICNGQQNYHLAYLPNLTVGSAHTGSISVPARDFGRGWCVIVYSDATRNVVLVTQPI
jgi:hypothetical protein